MRNKCISLNKTAIVMFKNGKWRYNEKYRYSNRDTEVSTYIQFVTEFESRIEAIAFANIIKRQSMKYKTDISEFLACLSRHSMQPIIKSLPLSEFKYLFGNKQYAKC